MTMSKGGSQEASSKIRCSSNTLNPDAPEFNPRTKSTGKLNANAPEFVPGQLHNFESVMINMPEIKGYKNGHMPTYTISHQEQCVPVWVPQSYPVNVPIPHFYNNAPIDLISCDFTQTQNYPIQRNVYPTQSHNDYHINTPYNVVAQGKSKLNNKGNKTKQINKDTLSRENNKEHSKDKETVISARDNISVATTKDTTRDITTPIKDVIPEQNKPLTWAERTKLSTKQPPKPTIIPSIQTNITQSSNNNKEIPKDTIKEHKHISKDINKERDKLDKKDKDKLKSNLDLNRDLDEQYDKDIKSKDKKDKDNQIKTYGREYHEQASYAKVFKDAVKSSSSSSSSTSTSTNISNPKESRSEIQTELVKEVIRTTVSTVASSKDITSTISNEVNNKNNISSTSSTSTDVEMITSKDINKEQDKLDIIDTNKDNNNNTSTNVTSSSSSSSSSSTNNTVVTITSIQQSVDEKSNKDINNEYTVNIMLNYYVYLLKNIKLIDDIRDKYQLPKINFSTTNSTNTQNKSGYKDRERDRDRSDRDRTDRDRDKSDKKDWRHKSYDKNFGNNFRFNNKEFSRASNEFTPTVVASETSWVIKQAKQKNDKEALLRRKIMGLLNRLTFEKFDIIYKQIIECGIDTPEHAEMLVRFVFEKAVTQHHFIPMYVELCAKLAIDLYTIDNSSSTNSTVSSINKIITKETNQDKLDVTDTNKDNNNNTSTNTNVTSNSNNDTSSSSTVVVEQTNELDKNAVEKISDELLNKDTRYSSEENTDNSTDNNKTNKDDTDDTNNDNNNSTNTNVTSSISSSNNNNTTSSGNNSSSSTNSTSLGEDNNNNKENMNKYIIKEDNTDKQTSSTYQNTDNILIKTNEYITATSSLEGSSLNQDELIDPKSNRKSDFMRILLNCSQDSFEDNLKPLEIPIELEGDDRFEFEQKYKHKMRGNMIFVGELFKQRLLAAKLLITCLDQVFLKREECILLYDDVNMGNNHLEAMCTLLQTVGRSFDTNRWKHLSEFEKRIQHLEDLGKNEHISFRIRCLIKNVLDSRMERWDKSIYQIQDQPCKLQELRHKHSSSTFNLLTTNNSNSNLNIGSNKDNNNNKERDKKDKSDKDDKDEVWRMKYRRNKSSNNLVGFGKTDKNKKDISRNKDIYLDNIEIKNNKNIDKDIKSKDKKDNKNKQENNIDNNNNKNKEIKENKQNIENKNKLNDLEEEEEEDIELYDRDKSDLDDEYEVDDEVDVDDDDEEDDGYDDEYRYNEKLYKNVKSIVSELILSHDIEESNTRVEELNLEKNKLNYFYKLLIINCMEKCSKVNADKESKLITKWIVDLSIQKNTINNLIEGLYEFVFGEDENSMNILIEDYPLLPNTLKLLIDNMNSECNQNQKFKEILTQI